MKQCREPSPIRMVPCGRPQGHDQHEDWHVAEDGVTRWPTLHLILSESEPKEVKPFRTFRGRRSRGQTLGTIGSSSRRSGPRRINAKEMEREVGTPRQWQ
jgi:hypothetical protein